MKPLSTAVFAGIFTFTLSGCGVLGTANPPAANNGNVGDSGCLNNSKNIVSRYVAGEINQSEWRSSFDCINTSLDFFTSYVRGANPDSYSTSDMYLLISRFLITNRPVHEELMASAFSLKSALFGGNSQEFTKEEITILKSALSRLGAITGDLIPYLALRKSANPDLDQLNDMVTAFKRAGDQLADFINTLPVGMLSDQALDALINELTVSLDLPTIDDLGGKVFLAKWLMLNTRKDALVESDWAQIFRNAMGLGGIMLAYKTAVGEDVLAPRHQVMARLENDRQFRDFLWNLGDQIKPYLQAMVDRHGGFIPIPLFEHLVDALPPEMLDNVPKQYLKSALKPFIRKILGSSTLVGIDQGVIDTIYGLIGNIIQDADLLDRFYEKTGLDRESVKPTILSQSMEQFQGGLNATDKARFIEIKKKIFTHHPQFHKRASDGNQTIYYSNLYGYSHYQSYLVLTLDRVFTHLQKYYGSAEKAFTPSDITALLKDFTEVLFAFKVVDPTIPNFGPNRIRDMDLFTPVGNGDNLGSIPELISYAMTLISAGDLTTRMREKITKVCDQNIGQDLMGWTLLPANCFRTHFNDNLSAWLDDFPRLQAYWNNLQPEDQKRAMRWLEHGSRRDGFTEEEFGKFDIGAMATVLHYVENLFIRFDFDQNEILTKAEVNSAYPVFKGIIQRTAQKQGSNLKGDYLIKGVFSYIVKYRMMPETKGLGNLAKLGWWLAVYTLPTTNYNASRLGVFNIVCQLAAPENPNVAPPLSVACAP